MSRILRLTEIRHQNDYDATEDLAIAVAADVLAIPVTHAHVAKTTGGDGEALTLANGKPNQILSIIITVDGGGTGTLTPATATGLRPNTLRTVASVFSSPAWQQPQSNTSPSPVSSTSERSSR